MLLAGVHLQLSQGIQLTDLSLASLAAASAHPNGNRTGLPPSSVAHSSALDAAASAAAAAAWGTPEEGMAATPGLPPAHVMALNQALGYHKMVGYRLWKSLGLQSTASLSYRKMVGGMLLRCLCSVLNPLLCPVLIHRRLAPFQCTLRGM
eukprot:1157834-Pelagomonas_calceolata.AAC.18